MASNLKLQTLPIIVAVGLTLLLLHWLDNHLGLNLLVVVHFLVGFVLFSQFLSCWSIGLLRIINLFSGFASDRIGNLHVLFTEVIASFGSNAVDSRVILAKGQGDRSTASTFLLALSGLSGLETSLHLATMINRFTGPNSIITRTTPLIIRLGGFADRITRHL